MKNFAEVNGLEYYFEKSEESYIRFYFKKPAWNNQCWINSLMKMRNVLMVYVITQIREFHKKK